MALPFARSADFPIDKAAGVPCPHLAVEHQCTIHAELRPRGFSGCTAYDCFGAGQHVSQHTFGGRDWRAHPEIAAGMFAVLPVMRALHELLVVLAQARSAAPEQLADEVGAALTGVRLLTDRPADEVLAVDITALRRSVGDLLARVSTRLRQGSDPDHRPRDARHADLAGTDLAGADLRWADLRGALLIGADLRGADLRGADLLGADLRGAELSGADLTGVLFLTAPQLAAAKGDAGTVLPPHLRRPAQWAARASGVARSGPRRTS